VAASGFSEYTFTSHDSPLFGVDQDYGGQLVTTKVIDQPEDIYLCIDGSWRVTLQLSIQHGYTQTETEMSCLKTEMSLTMNFLPVYTTAVPGYNHQLLVLVQHTVFAATQ